MVVRHLIDRGVALFSFLPVGVDRLARAAVPALRGRSVVVPVALGLLALILPALVLAGASLVITRAAPSEVIERRTYGMTMLEVVGRAYDSGLPAGTDAEGRPLRWLAVRDGPLERSMLLVRTPATPEALRTRSVIARVETDANLVGAVTDALADRGAPGPGDPSSATELAGRYLVELDEAPDGVRALEDPAAIAELPDGTVVRVELRLTGEGIAPCRLDGSCRARELAAGAGTWLLRAAGATTRQAVLLATRYPPNALPVAVIGEQVRDEPAVAAVAATGPGDVLFGWGRLLPHAVLDHDPELPIDRSWPAVALLAAVGLWLLLARRRLYPAFRHEATPAGWARPAGPAAVSGRATGSLVAGDAAPRDVVDVPVSVVSGGDGPPRVEVELPEGPVRIDVPLAGSAVSGIEHGRLAWLLRSRPALWLHWYGTDLRVAFDAEADRAAAASILADATRRPAQAPPGAGPPPPRPRRRPEAEREADEPPPVFRRPRPRGVR